MNINVNGSIIINNLDNVDFKNLEIGQQILVLNKEKFYDSNNNKCVYNNVTNYFLRNKIVPEIYCFDKLNFNMHVEDSYDNCQMYGRLQDDEEFYLVIKNDKCKLEYIEPLNLINSDEEFISEELLEKFKHLNTKYTVNDFVIRDSINTHNAIEERQKIKYTKSIVNYYATINFENFILAINIKYDICQGTYMFTSIPKFYIFDNEFEKVSIVKIDNVNIKNLINIIKNNFNSIYYEDCITHLTLLNITLKDMRKDYTNKLMFMNAFKNIYMPHNDMYSFANELIKPILIDDKQKLKAYLKQSPNEPIVDVDIEYEEYKYNDKEFKDAYKIFSLKAKHLLLFLTKKSLINIFTGEILHDRYTKSYEDYQYFCLKNIDTGYETIFEKLPDMYVLIDWIDRDIAKKTIQERIQICDILTQ